MHEVDIKGFLSLFLFFIAYFSLFTFYIVHFCLLMLFKRKLKFFYSYVYMAFRIRALEESVCAFSMRWLEVKNLK